MIFCLITIIISAFVILIEESLCLYHIKSRFQTCDCLIELYGRLLTRINSSYLKTSESTVSPRIVITILKTFFTLLDSSKHRMNGSAIVISVIIQICHRPEFIIPITYISEES